MKNEEDEEGEHLKRAYKGRKYVQQQIKFIDVVVSK
jgi:hypothetical protein